MKELVCCSILQFFDEVQCNMLALDIYQFPVDVDGIGKCPEPACCTELRQKIEECCNKPAPSCNLGSFGPVQFKSGSSVLSATAKAQLDDVARQLNENATCNFKVTFTLAKKTSISKNGKECH